MKSNRTLPPTYFLLSIMAMSIFHFTLPVMQLLHFPYTLLGTLPMVMGIALNLVADSALKTQSTTVKPFEISTALVTTSAYRICRHPMYLGMVLILTGIALLMGSLTPLLVPVVFGISMEVVFIRAEEIMLEQCFGTLWQEYKRRVRRWI